MDNKKGKIFAVIFFAALLLFANRVLAAEILFDAKTQDVTVGGKVEVGVYADTAGETANAVEGDIYFPVASFDLDGFYDGSSVLPLWIKQPALSSPGIVSFSGIVPGGFNDTKGYLFSLVLTAKQTGSAMIGVRSERILLNDGQGTAAAVTSSPLALNIVAAGAAPSFVPSSDRTPPELFAPKVARDDNVFDGKWFVTFVAQDKDSGIDHYSVCEGTSKCVVAESPYFLQNQNLDVDIIVKAADKSGNERSAFIKSPHERPWFVQYMGYVIPAIIILMALLIIYSLYLWRARPRSSL